MMKLRKPTELQRATVQQEARVIVPAEAGGGATDFRRVQILVPEGESVALVGIDKRPEDLGPARTYKLCQFPVNQPITLHIGPQQWVIAASFKANLELSVIVEYYAGGA